MTLVPDQLAVSPTPPPHPWNDFIDRHSRFVHSTAWYFSGDEHVAEDAAQVVFMNLFKAAPEGPEDLPLEVWLGRLWVRARNAACDQVKSRTVRTSHEQRYAATALTVVPPGQRDPVEDLEEIQRIMSAMREIRPDYAEVILLQDIEGLTFNEIASLLGIPFGTVRSRYYRGCQQLHQILCVGEVDAATN